MHFLCIHVCTQFHHFVLLFGEGSFVLIEGTYRSGEQGWDGTEADV